MLEKDCNDNPISTFPPCYAFQMIFTALAPRLIQSICCNVHNKFRALKQLCQQVLGGFIFTPPHPPTSSPVQLIPPLTSYSVSCLPFPPGQDQLPLPTLDQAIIPGRSHIRKLLNSYFDCVGWYSSENK